MVAVNKLEAFTDFSFFARKTYLNIRHKVGLNLNEPHHAASNPRFNSISPELFSFYGYARHITVRFRKNLQLIPRLSSQIDQISFFFFKPHNCSFGFYISELHTS